MNSLLKAFESDDVEIYPLIPIEGMNPTDLFILFPKKAYLIVSIRSKGHAEIVHNEKTEAVEIKRKDESGKCSLGIS